jgi:hypothetical protein
MDSERELKCLAAVWALRGILTPEGFKGFKLEDGLVGWDKEELEELLDYVKGKETPATVQLLSANSLTTLEKGVEAVTRTRKGVFFKNLAELGELLKLTEAERDVLLFVMLFREEPGLRQALHELNCCGVQEFYDYLARILKLPEPEIRLAVRKDGTLATAGLLQVYKGIHRSVELEPLEGLYKALCKREGGVERILGMYFTKSPTPSLSLVSGSCLKPPTASSCSTKLRMPFPYPTFFLFTPMHHVNSLKGWTNRLLETNPVPAVYICNQLDGIDPAHVRRFDLVIEVPVPPLRAREKILATRLGGLKVGESFLRALAANVHLAPAHVDKAAKVADYCQPRTPEANGKIIKTVIGNVHKALNLRPGKGFGQPLDSSFSGSSSLFLGKIVVNVLIL